MIGQREASPLSQSATEPALAGGDVSYAKLFAIKRRQFEHPSRCTTFALPLSLSVQLERDGRHQQHVKTREEFLDAADSEGDFRALDRALMDAAAVTCGDVFING